MGKNTPERQEFIIDNLRVVKDLAENPAKQTESSDSEDLNIAS
jgi:hypothetical protein